MPPPPLDPPAESRERMLGFFLGLGAGVPLLASAERPDAYSALIRAILASIVVSASPAPRVSCVLIVFPAVAGNERDEWLSNLQFAVFGLGNRQYENFIKVLLVGKVVDQLLVEQGGKGIVPLGLGDDDQCIEEDFNALYELQ